MIIIDSGFPFQNVDFVHEYALFKRNPDSGLITPVIQGEQMPDFHTLFIKAFPEE